VHGFPHDPQLELSVLVSVQLPPQQLNPLQLLPQFPQLVGSLKMSVHCPPQQVPSQN